MPNLDPPHPRWNPESDEHIPVNYNAANFKAGKAANKVALQKELGLPVNPDIPMLVGCSAVCVCLCVCCVYWVKARA